MSVFDGLVKYAAGSRMDNDAWATLVKECAHVWNGNLIDLQTVLKNAENEFKEKTGETTLPSAYRSAKSVVLSSYLNDVPTMSDNGEPIGKSAVERAIKDKRPPKEPKTGDEYVSEGLDLIQKGLHMAVTAAERIALTAYIETNIPTILGK
jgi:hypothetical protein